MLFNYKKLLNLEIPKELEPLIQDQVEKTLLRAINGLEFIIKKDIRPPSNVNKKLLYQEKYISLYHYLPKNENVYSVPVVLVPPLMVTTDIFGRRLRGWNVRGQRHVRRGRARCDDQHGRRRS
jgi:hypothetical protein